MSIPLLIITDTFGDWQYTINDIITDLNSATFNAVADKLVRYDSSSSLHINNLDLNQLTANNNIIIKNENPGFTLIDTGEIVQRFGGTTPYDDHYLNFKLTDEGKNLKISDYTKTYITPFTYNEVNTDWMEFEKSTKTANIFGSTVWREDNDGAGSGLDADKLDGLHLTEIREDLVKLTQLHNVDGTIFSFEPETAGGHNIVNFMSKVSPGSEKGFILFQDESAFCEGTGTEDMRLTIGVYNDFRHSSSHSDELWLQGGGRLVYNVGSWDSELDTIVGSPGVGTTGGFEWLVNNLNVMTLAHDGKLTVKDDIASTNGDVIAAASDDRLKENRQKINNALDKIDKIEAFYFNYNELGQSLGFNDTKQVGISAQELKEVLPELVTLSPADIDEKGNSISGENYLTVNYHKLSVLLLNGIKELKKEIETIKEKL